jgi:hypothetical protein
MLSTTGREIAGAAGPAKRDLRVYQFHHPGKVHTEHDLTEVYLGGQLTYGCSNYEVSAHYDSREQP